MEMTAFFFCQSRQNAVSKGWFLKKYKITFVSIAKNVAFLQVISHYISNNLQI